MLFFIPVASGDIVSDILRTEYLDCAYELDYFDPVSPEINMQHSNHIHAWVDIVGFKNMTCIDGVYYVPGIPANVALIYSGKSESARSWNGYVDDFSSYIDVTSNQTHIIANMDINLYWHESTFKSRSIHTIFGSKTISWICKDYYHESASIQDVELLPISYNDDFGNVSLNVVVYNNSVSPKTTVYTYGVPVNTVSINYTYENDSIIHYLYSAQKEYTSKNVPYMNLSSIDIWTDDSNLSRYGDIVVIPTCNFSIDSMNVTVTSPYDSYRIDNVTLSNVSWSGAGDTFSSFFILFVGICMIFIIGIYFNLRRLKL